MATYIYRDEKIMGGEPVIVGTRIPAVRLVYLLKQGYTEDTIKREFPHLSKKTIRGALFELSSTGLQSI